MAETNSNNSSKLTISAAGSKPSAKAKAASSSAKNSRTLTPSEVAYMLQYAREAAKKRREANRMSPEELAEFKAWNAELDKQMLPGKRHLMMSVIREQREQENSTTKA